jgi:hypothetical protein
LIDARYDFSDRQEGADACIFAQNSEDDPDCAIATTIFV